MPIERAVPAIMLAAASTEAALRSGIFCSAIFVTCSLVIVAKEYLNMEVEERKISKDEIADFAECGLCGTAAVISPVGQIDDHGKEIKFNDGKQEMGPVLTKIYDTLTGIQMGRLPAPEGWIYTI